MDDFPLIFHNLIVIGIFAALAYVFAKWWIVLFAALFIATRNNDEEVE